MPEPLPIDRQAEVASGDFVLALAPQVGPGDRRDQVRDEPDAGQTTRLSHLVKPTVLPPDGDTRGTPDVSATILQDAAVIRSGRSLWDASPDVETGDPRDR